MTIRRWVASRSTAGTVTDPCTVTVPLPATIAEAIERTGPGPATAFDDGCGVADADGPLSRTTSADERAQIRKPSAAPFRLARWPTIPVIRRWSPTTIEVVTRPA